MVQNSAIKDIFENGEWYHTVSFNDFKSELSTIQNLFMN